MAHDAGPSNVFAKLAGVFEGSTVLVANGGKTAVSDDVLEERIATASFLMLGMSFPEKNAELEIRAGKMALHHGVPFGFFSDAPGAFKRPSFEELRKSASLVCLSADDRDAHKYFPKCSPMTKIVCTGSPAWEDYFLPADRFEARALMGAHDGETVILSPGIRDPIINIQMWSACLEATAIIQEDSALKFALVLTKHPGDTTPVEAYTALEEHGRILGIRVLFPSHKSDLLVPGADAVVHNQNSSVGLHAMCRRIPVVDFYGRIAMARLKNQAGSDRGQFFGTDAVGEVYNASPDTLAGALESAMLYNRSSQEARQEKLLPKLQQGEAGAKIKAAIESI